MKYSVLVSDIDGTLVSDVKNALPTGIVREAVIKASRLVTVCLATGRSLQYTEGIIESLRITGPCIFSNGAVIYDPVKKTVIQKHPLTDYDIKTLITIVRTFGIPAFVRDDTGRYELNADYKPHGAHYVYFPPMLEKVIIEIEKVIRASHTMTIHKMSGSNTATDYMVTDIKASKQHAILEVAEILGISPHEIIGIGDGYNDFPLLMACGLKVAMGNAVPELKEIADYIAPTVQNDGVADVIEKFILCSDT